MRPCSSGAARGGLAFTASTKAPEVSLGGDDTTVIRAPAWLTTALNALRDVYVLWLQRWRRGWSRSLPAVDSKWPADARDENRMDMIDRRQPRPWPQLQPHKIINQDLLIIGERCVLLAGYRGVEARLPVCPLSAARSRLRVGYDVLWYQTRLILTKE